MWLQPRVRPQVLTGVEVCLHPHFDRTVCARVGSMMQVCATVFARRISTGPGKPTVSGGWGVEGWGQWGGAGGSSGVATPRQGIRRFSTGFMHALNAWHAATVTFYRHAATVTSGAGGCVQLLNMPSLIPHTMVVREEARLKYIRHAASVKTPRNRRAPAAHHVGVPLQPAGRGSPAVAVRHWFSDWTDVRCRLHSSGCAGEMVRVCANRGAFARRLGR